MSISSNDRLKLFVQKGYFPRELPQVFTTSDLGSHSASLIEIWRSKKIFSEKKSIYKKVNMSNSFNYNLKDTELENISKPKKGYERRNVHITHPIPQILLSFELAENWNKILKTISKSKFTVDKLSLSNSHERGLNDINFKIHRLKKDFIQSTSDWIVKTDITRFYPSIYTHSIPWAAYGKEKVKSEIKKYNGSLADRIDQLVRATNRNQTIGIPIGPETSRIVAEIISARIDQDFADRVKILDPKQIDRLQDDWFLGLDSLADSESMLSEIRHVYREFGLEINGSKTSIEFVVNTHELQWRS